MYGFRTVSILWKIPLSALKSVAVIVAWELILDPLKERGKPSIAAMGGVVLEMDDAGKYPSAMCDLMRDSSSS